MTLKQLVEEHPEWANLPIVIGLSDGDITFVFSIYSLETDKDGEVLCLTPN